jgi:serine phosphatase RsbU (regulator of sigma subunit)
VELAPGDELLVITDGVTEAADPSMALFGDPRVAEWFGNEAREPEPLPRLLSLVRAFEAGSPPSDDIAAILMRLPGG